MNLPEPPPQVESRPLRYFIAVAEELNFARAAERLGIASPALSRAISQLETQLGVRLFDRSTRHVELTEAGLVLLEQARPALAALDAATRRARRATGPRHRLVLTLKADLEGGLLEPILAAYRAMHEAVPMEVSFADWGRQAELLRDGGADVALIHTDFDAEGLDFEVLLEEPMVVALTATHPLARLDTLTVADLGPDHAPSASPYLWWPAGTVDPPVFKGLSQMVQLIELGELVAFLPASVAARYPRPQLAIRPLTGVPDARLVVAWPRAATSPATAAFVRAATDVAAAGRGESSATRPAAETADPALTLRR